MKMQCNLLIIDSMEPLIDNGFKGKQFSYKLQMLDESSFHEGAKKILTPECEL